MAGPLVANPNPWNFDAPLFGKIYVTGVASGLGLAQQNATLGDIGLHADVSNAHAIAQTTEVVGGTGAFAAASGTSVSTLSGRGSLARNPDGSCAFDRQPLHEEDKIELVGTAVVPG